MLCLLPYELFGERHSVTSSVDVCRHGGGVGLVVVLVVLVVVVVVLVMMSGVCCVCCIDGGGGGPGKEAVGTKTLELELFVHFWSDFSMHLNPRLIAREIQV